MNHPEQRHGIHFTWANAWLFQSIASAASQREASLREIVSIGDALNHAIFTNAELDGGLARLFAADLIEVRDRGLLLSDRGRELNNRVSRKRPALAQTGSASVPMHHDHDTAHQYGGE
jgi:hypothetical protein